MSGFAWTRIRRMGAVGVVAATGFGSMAAAHADSFYTHSMLLGERAAGMGGAFVAVADDASGGFYNPAGIALAVDDYLSVSVNAIQSSSTRFEDVFPTGGYELESLAFVPAFFGFTQKAGPGRFGFSLIVREIQQVDQNDRIDDISTATGSLLALNRQFGRERVTYLAGPSYALTLSPWLAVGMTAFGIYQSDKALDMQLGEYNPEGTGKYILKNTYLNRRAFGFQPRLGIMLTPFRSWSFGASVAKGFHIQGNGQARIVRTSTDETGEVVAPNGEFSHDYTVLQYSNLASRVYSPWEFSGGAAWFPSQELLFSMQVDYTTGDEELPDFAPYRPASFINASIGAEWYLLPQLPVRFGVYTNRSNSPSVQSDLMGQPEHIDLLGFSGGFSWVGAGSSLSASVSNAQGMGEGQVIGGRTTIQDAFRRELTVYLAGSYAL